MKPINPRVQGTVSQPTYILDKVSEQQAARASRDVGVLYACMYPYISPSATIYIQYMHGKLVALSELI